MGNMFERFAVKVVKIRILMKDVIAKTIKIEEVLW
jgi:hypothetical protein